MESNFNREQHSGSITAGPVAQTLTSLTIVFKGLKTTKFSLKSRESDIGLFYEYHKLSMSVLPVTQI